MKVLGHTRVITQSLNLFSCYLTFRVCFIFQVLRHLKPNHEQIDPWIIEKISRTITVWIFIYNSLHKKLKDWEREKIVRSGDKKVNSRSRSSSKLGFFFMNYTFIKSWFSVKITTIDTKNFNITDLKQNPDRKVTSNYTNLHISSSSSTPGI